MKKGHNGVWIITEPFTEGIGVVIYSIATPESLSAVCYSTPLNSFKLRAGVAIGYTNNGYPGKYKGTEQEGQLSVGWRKVDKSNCE